MPAIFVVLVGVVFLLERIGILDTREFKLILPIMVIVAGLQMLFRKKCHCCDAP